VILSNNITCNCTSKNPKNNNIHHVLKTLENNTNITFSLKGRRELNCFLRILEFLSGAQQREKYIEGNIDFKIDKMKKV
jgi:hypothetical protein